MAWSHWRFLADEDTWHIEDLSYEGAACYELGIRRKWKRRVIPVYVGNTGNLFIRMDQYARDGSHLRGLLLKYWKHDYVLYFKYSQNRKKETAQKEEKKLLSKFGLERYPWNTQLD